MYEFDVKYTFDDYLEYYRFVLIKQRFVRDLIFSLLFIAFGIYFFIKILWFTPEGEEAQPIALPILAVAMGIILPLMNLLTLPMLKKQLKAKQDQINATHLSVTFKEDEVLYINLNAPEEEAKPETEEKQTEETSAVEESTEEKPAEETKEEKEQTEEKKNNDREFHLQYNNFMQIRETKNLFLYYLDRQTIVIIPKNTSMFGNDFAAYREFILSKVNKKRVKFLKEKN